MGYNVGKEKNKINGTSLSELADQTIKQLCLQMGVQGSQLQMYSFA